MGPSVEKSIKYFPIRRSTRLPLEIPLRVTSLDPKIELYDPSGALGTNYRRGDNWKNFRYNFGAKPKPYPASAELAKHAFNGVTIGKGHLAEAKAAINRPRAAMAGAQSVFQRREERHEHSNGGSCGSDDTSQRDGLMPKIDDTKKI